MKRYLIIGLLFLAIAAFIFIPLMKNDSTEISEMAEFKFERELMQAKYGYEIPIAFTVPKSIDKVELFYGDSLLQSFPAPAGKEFTYTLDAGYYGVGTRRLELRSYYEDGTIQNDNISLRVVSDIIPNSLKANILKSFPHSKENYTQGLEFNNGELYESTGDPGQQGKTTVGKMNMASGEFSALKNGLDATYFGEGITILGNTLYQLTWQNGICFLYDKNTMQVKKESFTYTGEGWGLCNNGKEIIMSDGTERITFRDPKTFRVIRTIEVYDNFGPRNLLNELEYIDGKIYANVYQSSTIIAIDPNTGRVLDEIDCLELEIQGKNGGDVLNGIAYNPLTKLTYVTGKYWTKMFQISLTK